MHRLPAMNERRMNHCQIILKNFLFVFFGFKDFSPFHSNTIEYLDLRDPKATFQILNIGNYGSPYFVEPMVFF